MLLDNSAQATHRKCIKDSNEEERGLIDTINQLNVYFKSDGGVVYDIGLNEIDTEEEKGKFSEIFLRGGRGVTAKAEKIVDFLISFCNFFSLSYGLFKRFVI